MEQSMTDQLVAHERGALPASVLSQLGVEPPPALRCRTLGGANFHVSRLRRRVDEPGALTALPNEDGWAIHLLLQDVPTRRLVVDGLDTPADAYRTGAASLCDLRRDIAVAPTSPFDCVRFFLPRAALDELAEELGTQRVAHLEFEHGRQIDDPVLRNLAGSLMPTLDRPDAANGLFIDHMALAFRVHVATTYGRWQAPQQAQRGGLAPWQERRAKDLLEAHLEGNIPLDEVAQACRLSVSYFSQAFKQCTGLPPHRWLLRRRVSKAKTLLRGTALPLAEVALECGFADQSHFSRVFGQWAGATPGAWRRWAGSGQPVTERASA
jgi:AraC-like DNA-binding protein